MVCNGCVYQRCGCTDPVTGRQYGRACPRLAAGSRHGSWYVRLELPAGLDGHRRRIRRGGYPSRKAAVAVLARLQAPRPGDTGVRVLTVGDWLAHWLVSRTAPASSTMRGYTAHVRLYLGPYLGEVAGELARRSYCRALARDRRLRSCRRLSRRWDTTAAPSTLSSLFPVAVGGAGP
jgi:hypothetical protein